MPFFIRAAGDRSGVIMPFPAPKVAGDFVEEEVMDDIKIRRENAEILILNRVLRLYGEDNAVDAGGNRSPNEGETSMGVDRIQGLA